MQLDISYIVPVYNVRQYLTRCVESLLHQSIQSYEIILVDDGSTDGSAELIDSLCEVYSQIRAIHKVNGGLSSARNAGMKEAKGKYILFVDSDDWLIENSVQKLLEEAEYFRLDVGVGDFQYYYDDGNIIENRIKPLHTDEVITGERFFQINLSRKTNLNMVWKSIYRTEFLIENKLYFREGYNHEDEEWTPRVYLKAQRTKDINAVFYNYFIRSNSISQDSRCYANNSYDLVSNCHELKKLSSEIKNNELRNLFQDSIAGVYLSAVYKGNLVGKQYSDLVNRSFFTGLYLSRKTKFKAHLFIVNKRLYCAVNRIVKSL